MDEATLKDLAFGFRSWREVDKVDLRLCLSGASYAAAEKTERRMALKIFWEQGHSQIPVFFLDSKPYLSYKH